MAIIKIYANGIELDYDRDTLTIKKENNAFITDFKVNHSTFPFMVIENDAAMQALGPRDITSVLKKKIVQVHVHELDQAYLGELEIIDYLQGYRKCNLKYGSLALTALNKKLSELLPVISITGAVNPVPFTEEALAPVPGYADWETWPLQFIGKVYPEVNFQFPKMGWRDKYAESDDQTDEWYSYLYHYNNYYLVGNSQQLRMLPNKYDLVNGHPENTNLPSPQLFLLGILKYAFAYAGYTITGDFTTDAFIRHLLVLSTKANLCKVGMSNPGTILNFAGAGYVQQSQIPGYVTYNFHYKLQPVTAAGEYVMKFKVRESLRPGGVYENAVSQLTLVAGGNSQNVYSNYNNPDSLLFEGEATFTVTPDMIGLNMGFVYYVRNDMGGTPAEFQVEILQNPIPWQMQHPTIPLGRYAPDWTLATFLNEVKNLFSLDITIDDIAKKVHFNYTRDIINAPAKHIALKSLAVQRHSPADNIAIILKYDNDVDASLYITKEGVELNKKDDSDYVTTIDSKFKLVPLKNGTADLSGIESKSGVGLMVYDETAIPLPEMGYGGKIIPVISDSFQGSNLNINGPGGIYERYWKVTARFRLNASSLELKGPFTKTEIAQINDIKKIYVDNQAYAVLSIEFNETSQSNFDVQFNVNSITF